MIITTGLFVGAAIGAKLGSSAGIAAAGTAIAGTGPGAILGGAAGAALAKGAVWYVGAAAAAPAAGAGAVVGMATTAAALAASAGACLSKTRPRPCRGHADIDELETLIERLDAEQARLDAQPEPEWIMPPLDINKIPIEELRVKTLTEIRAEWQAKHERERRETIALRTPQIRTTRTDH